MKSKPLSERLSWSGELNEESRGLVREVLKDTHERFIQHVEEKRGSKIVVMGNLNYGILMYKIREMKLVKKMNYMMEAFSLVKTLKKKGTNLI